MDHQWRRSLGFEEETETPLVSGTTILMAIDLALNKD
jgi:hypothetical protein